MRKNLLYDDSAVDFFIDGDTVSHIKSVMPRENYCLEVFLDNGSNIMLNMADRLKTLRFGMLEDKEFFRQVTTDGICIGGAAKSRYQRMSFFSWQKIKKFNR